MPVATCEGIESYQAADITLAKIFRIKPNYKSQRHAAEAKSKDTIGYEHAAGYPQPDSISNQKIFQQLLGLFTYDNLSRKRV